ncbi:MAG: ABC transporter ATP-binding protein [Acidobacteriota bacterium]|nr:MAG: ABC transporter ATP-binding protein [Acidobacteriota bacterium]
MLEARNISVRYGDKTVVAGVSLSIEAGRVLALVGSNGAGKTTLLRALNGSITAQISGDIMLNGQHFANLSRREIARQIAVVSQENETRFPITVLEFVLAGRFVHGSALGWETPEDIASAERALDDCDLEGFAGRFMNELSGGERQRVVLARALATNARILLLDEPTANLDIAHQAMMFRLVRERCGSCGSAAVVITHDLNLAAEFADEIVMLLDGKVAASGKPATVLTEKNIAEVFGVKVLLDANPASGNVRVTNVF